MLHRVSAPLVFVQCLRLAHEAFTVEPGVKTPHVVVTALPAGIDAVLLPAFQLTYQNGTFDTRKRTQIVRCARINNTTIQTSLESLTQPTVSYSANLEPATNSKQIPRPFTVQFSPAVFRSVLYSTVYLFSPEPVRVLLRSHPKIRGLVQRLRQFLRHLKPLGSSCPARSPVIFPCHLLVCIDAFRNGELLIRSRLGRSECSDFRWKSLNRNKHGHMPTNSTQLSDGMIVQELR